MPRQKWCWQYFWAGISKAKNFTFNYLDVTFFSLHVRRNEYLPYMAGRALSFLIFYNKDNVFIVWGHVLTQIGQLCMGMHNFNFMLDQSETGPVEKLYSKPVCPTPPLHNLPHPYMTYPTPAWPTPSPTWPTPPYMTLHVMSVGHKGDQFKIWTFYYICKKGCWIHSRSQQEQSKSSFYLIYFWMF